METITLSDTVWVKTDKKIWQGKVTRIPYIDMWCDQNYLKTKWLDTQSEGRILIKICHCNTLKR